ncbi:Epstein-Barr virus nuclear antigen 3B domain protein [Azobacteroides phage ProJPt-Bp1]|uniref:Epstein-Barr virus nuclear antigen 3B domain protein n=1 Tax=Azobacteroides phage ProJPt-Bp1 TaxID=1920526 RepID=A0A1V1FGY1_9CAUD|nr:Epstein-Barr virus nuclear antigen 3B domain protein [Azobacteroides phage ProJPt-Bp1]BAX03441.1 Epstein-Barr virus nuclear antigen 3B domain protein [Azobacteroides phage ProJPt-Bp1]
MSSKSSKIKSGIGYGASAPLSILSGWAAREGIKAFKSRNTLDDDVELKKMNERGEAKYIDRPWLKGTKYRDAVRDYIKDAENPEVLTKLYKDKRISGNTVFKSHAQPWSNRTVAFHPEFANRRVFGANFKDDGSEARYYDTLGRVMNQSNYDQYKQNVNELFGPMQNVALAIQKATAKRNMYVNAKNALGTTTEGDKTGYLNKFKEDDIINEYNLGDRFSTEHLNAAEDALRAVKYARKKGYDDYITKKGLPDIDIVAEEQRTRNPFSPEVRDRLARQSVNPEAQVLPDSESAGPEMPPVEGVAPPMINASGFRMPSEASAGSLAHGGSIPRYSQGGQMPAYEDGGLATGLLGRRLQNSDLAYLGSAAGYKGAKDYLAKYNYPSYENVLQDRIGRIFGNGDLAKSAVRQASRLGRTANNYLKKIGMAGQNWITEGGFAPKEGEPNKLQSAGNTAVKTVSDAAVNMANERQKVDDEMMMNPGKYFESKGYIPGTYAFDQAMYRHMNGLPVSTGNDYLGYNVDYTAPVGRTNMATATGAPAAPQANPHTGTQSTARADIPDGVDDMDDAQAATQAATPAATPQRNLASFYNIGDEIPDEVEMPPQPQDQDSAYYVNRTGSRFSLPEDVNEAPRNFHTMQELSLNAPREWPNYKGLNKNITVPYQDRRNREDTRDLGNPVTREGVPQELPGSLPFDLDVPPVAKAGLRNFPQFARNVSNGGRTYIGAGGVELSTGDNPNDPFAHLIEDPNDPLGYTEQNRFTGINPNAGGRLVAGPIPVDRRPTTTTYRSHFTPERSTILEPNPTSMSTLNPGYSSRPGNWSNPPVNRTPGYQPRFQPVGYTLPGIPEPPDYGATTVMGGQPGPGFVAPPTDPIGAPGELGAPRVQRRAANNTTPAQSSVAPPGAFNTNTQPNAPGALQPTPPPAGPTTPSTAYATPTGTPGSTVAPARSRLQLSTPQAQNTPGASIYGNTALPYTEHDQGYMSAGGNLLPDDTAAASTRTTGTQNNAYGGEVRRYADGGTLTGLNGLRYPLYGIKQRDDIPQYGLGGWLKDQMSSMGKGLKNAGREINRGAHNLAHNVTHPGQWIRHAIRSAIEHGKQLPSVLRNAGKLANWAIHHPGQALMAGGKQLLHSLNPFKLDFWKSIVDPTYNFRRGYKWLEGDDSQGGRREGLAERDKGLPEAPAGQEQEEDQENYGAGGGAGGEGAALDERDMNSSVRNPWDEAKQRRDTDRDTGAAAMSGTRGQDTYRQMMYYLNQQQPHMPIQAHGGYVPRYAEGGRQDKQSVAPNISGVATGAASTIPIYYGVRGLSRWHDEKPFFKSHPEENRYLRIADQIRRMRAQNPELLAADNAHDNIVGSHFLDQIPFNGIPTRNAYHNFVENKVGDYSTWFEKNRKWVDKYLDKRYKALEEGLSAPNQNTMMTSNGPLNVNIEQPNGDMPQNPLPDVGLGQAYGGRVQRYANGGYTNPFAVPAYGFGGYAQQMQQQMQQQAMAQQAQAQSQQFQTEMARSMMEGQQQEQNAGMQDYRGRLLMEQYMNQGQGQGQGSYAQSGVYDPTGQGGNQMSPQGPQQSQQVEAQAAQVDPRIRARIPYYQMMYQKKSAQVSNPKGAMKRVMPPRMRG